MALMNCPGSNRFPFSRTRGRVNALGFNSSEIFLDMTFTLSSPSRRFTVRDDLDSEVDGFSRERLFFVVFFLVTSVPFMKHELDRLREAEERPEKDRPPHRPEEPPTRKRYEQVHQHAYDRHERRHHDLSSSSGNEARETLGKESFVSVGFHPRELTSPSIFTRRPLPPRLRRCPRASLEAMP